MNTATASVSGAIKATLMFGAAPGAPKSWFSAAPIEYLSAKDSAKLIRMRIAAQYPGAKVSVKSSRGGSIDVRWTDGPPVEPIRKLAGSYSSARFDGMIDMGYTVYHYLMPDGSAQLAYDPGTNRSGGLHPEYMTHQPEGARRVCFGADYVHTHRDYSIEFKQAVADRMAAKYGFDVPVILSISDYGSIQIANAHEMPRLDRREGFMHPIPYKYVRTVAELLEYECNESDARSFADRL